MIAPARRAAYDALLAVSRGQADLPDAIARARDRLADERDRGLLVELATGTVRWQAELDHVIAGASSRPLSKLDPEVLVILRLGVYQILHLDRIPKAAVVDDAVSLVRAARKTSAAGFVNALLRFVSRGRDRLPPRPRSAEPAHEEALDYLAVSLSHPRWLVERWLSRVGFAATEAWLRFNNSPAPLTLRANTLRIDRETLAARLSADGVRTRPTRFAPDGLVVEDGHPLRLPWADEGLFFAQDEVSQLVALLAAAAPGERVLDACAAPGGKTLVMAAAMKGQGLLVAADVRDRRIDLLAGAIARAGARTVAVVQADASQPLPFAPVFDAVLVDAPCSGLGVLRREADIRWRRTAEDLPRLADAEAAILRHAARVVRPGGRLVYATCSSEPDENEAIVEAFLASELTFRPADRDRVRRALPPAAAGLVTDRGHLQTWPWRDELEGFFGAVLLRVA